MAFSFRFPPFGEVLGQSKLGDMKTSAQIHDLSGVDRARYAHHSQLPGLGRNHDDATDLPVPGCLEEDVGIVAVTFGFDADDARPARPPELRANGVYVGHVVCAI